MNKKFFIVFLIVLAAPIFAQAATLGVVANNATPNINQPVRVDLPFDTKGDDANAIQAEIDFPAGQFSLVSISDGSSPVNFWIEQPAQTTPGVITFSGIIPGGFKGAADSIVSLWLLPIAPGVAKVSIGKVQLLRNDGQGSPIAVVTSSANIAISSVIASGTPVSPGSLIAPDPFTPVVSRDPNLYDGKYFLAFSTTDKGSGIDYYQVLEVPTASGGGTSAAWRTASSPYLLEDQSLSSDIYVRAVDHVGNSIVVEVPAEHSMSGHVQLALSDWLLIALYLILIAILFKVL